LKQQEPTPGKEMVSILYGDHYYTISYTFQIRAEYVTKNEDENQKWVIREASLKMF